MSCSHFWVQDLRRIRSPVSGRQRLRTPLLCSTSLQSEMGIIMRLKPHCTSLLKPELTHIAFGAGGSGGGTDTTDFRRRGGLGVLASGVCGTRHASVALQSGLSLEIGGLVGSCDACYYGVGVGSGGVQVRAGGL